MDAHVLLNLLNKLMKRDEMLGKPHILSLFLNLFNKVDNTGAGVLESAYHITMKSRFWCENAKILPFILNFAIGPSA